MVALLHGRRHVGAQPRQLDVAVHHADGLALRDEEPAAAEGHHGVPDQAVRRGGKFDRAKALPAREAIGRGRFLHVGRNGDHGVVEAEGHVPHLPGEDREDGRAFDAQQAAWKQRHEARDGGGQEAQYRDRLQHVEGGQDDGARDAVLRREIADAHREEQRERESDPHAQQRASGVVGDAGGGQVQRRRVAGMELHQHAAAEMHDAPQQAHHGQQQGDVDPGEAMRLVADDQLGGGAVHGCSGLCQISQCRRTPYTDTGPRSALQPGFTTRW